MNILGNPPKMHRVYFTPIPRVSLSFQPLANTIICESERATIGVVNNSDFFQT